MNPVLILTRNNLALTKRCVESVQQQDVPVGIFVVDNGSTDGTREWLQSEDFPGIVKINENNDGVSAGWNHGLSYIFGERTKGRHHFQSDHALVIGNDTVLPQWFYRELLAYEVPFVTGLAQENMDEIAEPKAPVPLDPHPDFSAFLIRRQAWETVGPFDERMKLYASDCDWHVRAHRKGISLWKANTSYYHERSSTLRLASEEDRQKILVQANEDRVMFRSLYGCIPGESVYDNLFQASTEP